MSLYVPSFLVILCTDWLITLSVQFCVSHPNIIDPPQRCGLIKDLTALNMPRSA